MTTKEDSFDACVRFNHNHNQKETKSSFSRMFQDSSPSDAIILDNNPLSIACYMEEHQNFKEQINKIELKIKKIENEMRRIARR